MVRKEVHSAKVEKIEVLGTEDEENDHGISDEEYRELYKQMVLARKFDERAFSIQRRGEISTYAPHKGQEAAQIGAVHAMTEEDWMVPSFRETAAFIARGASLKKLFMRWMGDTNGQTDLGNNLPVAIPVGTQNQHAAGIGMAMEKQGEKNAVVSFTGDGSTSEGDFHESLNFSGVFSGHNVFIVQNNQYAISMPVERQTNSDTLAQKAVAHGIDGVQVDGNDIIAVIKGVQEAIEKARNGEPVLLEALTYRLDDHTTSDDSTRYRDEDEVEKWKDKDPLKRFRDYLKDQGIWKDELEDFEEEAEKKIKEASNEAIDEDDPEMEEMFDYVYKDTPEILEKEKKQCQKFFGGDE
ncbi:MAG: pyruvate dehydrogenase (acetyl-transferring) E1 component subunit alpha [Candidatus Nanohalobium sp.]